MISLLVLAARRSPRLGDSATRRLGSTRRRSWLPSLLPLNKQNRDAGRGTADILLFCSAAKCYRWKLNGRAYLLDDSTTAARQGAQRVRPSEEEGSSLENSRRRRQISTTTTSALPLYPCRERLWWPYHPSTLPEADAATTLEKWKEEFNTTNEKMIAFCVESPT